VYPAEGSFEDMLSRAREELRGLAAAAEEAKTRSATGTAAHGWVRVTAVNGRVTDVHLDSRTTRLSPRELGTAITEAVNSALDELAAASPVPDLPPIDLAALDQQLAEVQLQTERQMGAYFDHITEALRRIR
jgi:hypothetical protein